MPGAAKPDWKPEYEKWRHGGWYVTNVRYPSGACGCVTNQLANGDDRWYIVADSTLTPFPSRDAAARAERVLAAGLANAPPGTQAKPDQHFPGATITL